MNKADNETSRPVLCVIARLLRGEIVANTFSCETKSALRGNMKRKRSRKINDTKQYLRITKHKRYETKNLE